MGCTFPDIDVTCDNWSATGGGSFTWHNNNSTAATISQDGSNTWPFVNFASGSSVSGNSTKACQMTTGANTYSYKVDGNVKHVIITGR
jgi:hypothetical protein